MSSSMLETLLMPSPRVLNGPQRSAFDVFASTHPIRFAPSPPPIPRIEYFVRPPLEQLFRDMWERKPTARPDAREVVTRLEKMYAELPTRYQAQS